MDAERVTTNHPRGNAVIRDGVTPFSVFPNGTRNRNRNTHMVLARHHSFRWIRRNVAALSLALVMGHWPVHAIAYPQLEFLNDTDIRLLVEDGVINLDTVFTLSVAENTKTSRTYRPLDCTEPNDFNRPQSICEGFAIVDAGSTTDETAASRTFYFEWLQPSGANYTFRGRPGGARASAFEGYEPVQEVIDAIYILLGAAVIGPLLDRMILRRIFPLRKDV